MHDRDDAGVTRQAKRPCRGQVGKSKNSMVKISLRSSSSVQMTYSKCRKDVEQTTSSSCLNGTKRARIQSSSSFRKNKRIKIARGRDQIIDIPHEQTNEPSCVFNRVVLSEDDPGSSKKIDLWKNRSTRVKKDGPSSLEEMDGQGSQSEVPITAKNDQRYPGHRYRRKRRPTILNTGKGNVNHLASLRSDRSVNCLNDGNKIDFNSNNDDHGGPPIKQHNHTEDRGIERFGKTASSDVYIVNPSGSTEPGMVALARASRMAPNICREDNTSADEALMQTPDDVQIPTLIQGSVHLTTSKRGTLALLGQGIYGYVVRGCFSSNDQTYDIVAKYFKPDLSTADDILSEARILQYLGRTGVVPKVYGLIEPPAVHQQLPVLIQECYGDGLTLDSLVEQCVPKKVWLYLCLQMAKALQKIHQLDVLINDIKPDNILIDYHLESPNINFIDMGLATFRSSYVSPAREADMSNCIHIAPEVRKQKPSSIKSDIYGLGYVFKTVLKYVTVTELQPLASAMTTEEPDNRVTLPTVLHWLNYLLKSHEPFVL